MWLKCKLVLQLHAVYTVHSPQYTVHSTQYTVHSTQYTVHVPWRTVLRDRGFGNYETVCIIIYQYNTGNNKYKKSTKLQVKISIMEK